jgi:hypothetical protein
MPVTDLLGITQALGRGDARIVTALSVRSHALLFQARQPQ